MPPRNAPLPNAVNLFNCALCDKGYPRQTEYENHLGSYDHTHRQRLSDMKKLTNANASTAAAPRPSKVHLDMHTISQDASKKPLGPRFTKIGASTAGGGRFTKVGVPVEEKETKLDQGNREAAKMAAQTDANPKVCQDEREDEHVDVDMDVDVVMADRGDDKHNNNTEDDEVISWEEYDLTKPSGCDHANCPGVHVLNTNNYQVPTRAA